MVEIDELTAQQFSQRRSRRCFATAHEAGQYHYRVIGIRTSNLEVGIICHATKAQVPLKTLAFANSSIVSRCLHCGYLQLPLRQMGMWAYQRGILRLNQRDYSPRMQLIQIGEPVVPTVQ